MAETQLIGSKEAAAFLGITRSRLQRLVHAGRLQPAHRAEGLRGAMVFDTASLERWAASRESGGAEHTAKRALVRGLYDDAGVKLTDEDADSLAHRTLTPVPTRRPGSTEGEAAV